MSTSSRLDREALDRLLEGRSARRDDLGALLAAVRAAGGPEELAGLEAAVAAFAAAPSTSRRTAGALAAVPAGAVPGRRRSGVGSFGARVAIAAAAGAAMLGGVALAVTTDGQPTSLPASSSAATVAAEHVPPAVPASTRASGAGQSDDETSAATSTEAEGRPSTVPAPALHGLCQAWVSRPSGAGRSESSAAFQVLVRTAGGADQVTAYCTSLLATAHPQHPSGRPTSRPGHSGATHVPGKPETLPPVTGIGNRPSGIPLPPVTQNRPTSLPSAVLSLPPGR